ncbi:alpha/beta hydrolase family protein [Trueperella pecoris]|uniref:alpha/beta hydrolase family protein n=1 Tax=Trueperella pecoris TaxID=2733571 RepID=UPI00186B77B5|nr:hypothetical protein [Trueperella pecoris]QOQ38270.1 hypothetical protein HLG82_01640 [Trueperella pecoris]
MDYEVGVDIVPSSEDNVIDWLRSLPVFPDAIEHYGQDPHQIIEWYGDPAAKPICFVHGGCFHDANALPATRPAARALAEAGYYVGLVDYRIADARPELTSSDAMKLAVHPVLGEAIWVGHDAGGAFAMNVVMAPETPVRAAVLLAPILDLARDVREDPEGHNGPTARWIGGSPEECPERYAMYDPMFNYYHVGPARFRARDLSIDIIHGADDQMIGVERSRDVRAEPFNLAIVEGADHIDLICPGQDAWVYFLGALASVE